ANLDLDTRGAHAAGFAVPGLGAVEHLGQDAGRGGLPGAPGTAEQVGVPDPPLPHGVAERTDDVVLPPHLGEALGPVAAVQRPVAGLRARLIGLAHHSSAPSA